MIQSYITESRQGKQFYKGDPVQNMFISKDGLLEQKIDEHSSSSFFDKWSMVYSIESIVVMYIMVDM